MRGFRSSIPSLVPVTFFIAGRVMSQFHDQPGVYDGREHMQREIWQIHEEHLLEQAAAAGDLLVVDRVFPPQMMAQFLQSLLWKSMPGGANTRAVLPTDEEITLGGMPYAEWATPPYDKLPGQAFDRVQMRIASHEDTTGLQVVDKSLHAMKVRLWEDVMPLTGNQWRRKRLDDPENFDLACQYISSTIGAFSYLNVDTLQESLGGVFNNIAAEWKDFEDALNALRATKNEPVVSMVSLWEEYVRLRWSIMTTRTHDWVMEHIDALRDILLEQLRQHDPPSLDTLSAQQWNITNKLHTLAELAAQAGYSIVLPMDGYIGHTSQRDSKDDMTDARIEKRKQEYSTELKHATRSRMVENTWEELIWGGGNFNTDIRIADPVSMVENILIQKEEQQVLRKRIAGHSTVPLVAEEWILNMKQFMDSPVYGIEKWGFVIYRITYEQSDQEWARYLEKLQADVDDWGEGVVGAELIRGTAQLRWIDGRDVGIAEGDFEAAKKHFTALAAEEGFQEKSDWDEVIFLFADAASVLSYSLPTEHVEGELLPHGDFGGFVTAVDAPFDPNDPGEHAEESPGFTGRMRIAGNLLWSDLFSLGKAQAASAEDLWPLAMQHPWQVYVGPVVSKQKEMRDATKQTFKHNAGFLTLMPAT